MLDVLIVRFGIGIGIDSIYGPPHSHPLDSDTDPDTDSDSFSITGNN